MAPYGADPATFGAIRSSIDRARGAERIEMVAGLIKYLRSAGRREDGQTLVEYALIIAFIAVALVASLTALGNGLANVYGGFADVFAGFNGGS